MPLTRPLSFNEEDDFPVPSFPIVRRDLPYTDTRSTSVPRATRNGIDSPRGDELDTEITQIRYQGLEGHKPVVAPVVPAADSLAPIAPAPDGSALTALPCTAPALDASKTAIDHADLAVFSVIAHDIGSLDAQTALEYLGLPIASFEWPTEQEAMPNPPILGKWYCIVKKVGIMAEK